MMENNDISQVRSKRDMLRERLVGKYPDRDFSDEEAFYGQISDDYDYYDKELGDYKEREKAFSDMFTSDPRTASFVTDWRNGEDPTIGLIRRFGSEIKDAIDDPKMQDKIAEANKEYVDRIEQSKKLDEEYKANIAETLRYLDQMVKDGKMQEEEIDDAMELLVKIVHDGIIGKFSPETIEMARKAISHDSDVAEAAHEAEVRGRNANIEEKLRGANKGDGMPTLSGKNGERSPRTRQSIFALASEAKT